MTHLLTEGEFKVGRGPG